MTDSREKDHLAAAANIDAAVTGADRRTLDTIFHNPLAHDVSWREVVSLFTAIGGADEKQNGAFEFRVGRDTLAMRRPHKSDLTSPDIMDLRHFLNHAGWSPNASTPKGDDAASHPSLIVVIDHAGAKIYEIDRTVDEAHSLTAYDPKHLLRHLERKVHDVDRDESKPEDERFFAQIANAVSAGGEIVVIGHGEGQSHAADQLSAYLKAHHKQTYARIVRKVVADLPHLTTPELLELGLRASGQR